MKIISSETQQPISGATFTLIPYRSMFRKGVDKPDQLLGESDRLGQFQWKLNSKEGVLVRAQGYCDASVGWIENGRIGLNSPWTPSLWKGSYPPSKNLQLKEEVVIQLMQTSATGASGEVGPK